MSAESPNSAGEVSGPCILWDFDHSLIDVNSDLWVPEKCGTEELKDFLRASVSTVQWTDLMHEKCGRLHAAGVSDAAIRQCLAEMSVFPEVLQVIRDANAAGCPQYVVSDANTVYISTFLDHHGLSRHFSAIMTNPSHWDETGRLHILRYHAPDLPPHGCPRCPVNMCKGAVIRKLCLQYDGRGSAGPAADGNGGGAGPASGAAASAVTTVAGAGSAKVSAGPRMPVLYVGDGKGDLCPCLLLGPGDTICARAGYPLAEHLKRGHVQPLVRATVVEWEDGAQLAAAIREAMAKAGAGAGSH